MARVPERCRRASGPAAGAARGHARLPGRRDRPTVAAVLAATTAWAVHAGVDWEWQLTAVSVWMFGLAGLALARRGPATRSGPPRLLRIIAALGCLVLARAGSRGS
jgi:glucose dehydrogenase